MQPRHRTSPPTNPTRICFCCAGDALEKPWTKVSYQERQRFTFIPRYTNPRLSQRSIRYCPKCEAQRCENMPGKNHYHLYRYIHLSGTPYINLQSLQIGRVINTVGGYRESFQLPMGTFNGKGPNIA